MSFKESALSLAARGFRVFPLKPGEKVPLFGLKWKDAATTDPVVIGRWWDQIPTANIGVACGPYTVLDLDTKPGKNGIQEAELLDADFDTLTVRTASGGLHLYYAAEGLGNRVRLAGTTGVDVRGQDGYVVGPGSVVKGGRYELIRDVAMAPLEPHLVELIGATPVRNREDREERDETPPAARVMAIEYLENRAPRSIKGEGGDQTAFKVAAAVRDYGVALDDALDLMMEHWNIRNIPNWEPDKLMVKIENAYRYAANDKPTHDVTALFQGLEGLTPPPPLPSAAAAEPETLFEFMTVRKSKDLPPPDWLLHRTLPRVGVACVYGASGSGKSLVLADLIQAVGLGRDWCGASVRHKGGSLIFAAEAADIIGPRFEHAKAPDDLPVVWADCPSFLGTPDKWQVLARGIDEGREALQREFGAELRVVAIDTYAASGVVEDENDNTMTAGALATLSQYARKAGVLILLLHHPAKGSEDLRGAGAFLGGLDAAIHVKKSTGALREVKMTKNRRAPERQLGAFTIEESVFYVDGERDSVPVLKWAPEVDVPVVEPQRTGNVIQALETLGGSSKIEALRDQFKALVPLTTTADSVFDAAVEWLLKQGKIEQHGYFLKLPKNA